MEENVDAANMEEDIDGELADLESLNYDDLDNVSKLQKSQRYNDIMQVRSWTLHISTEVLTVGTLLVFLRHC